MFWAILISVIIVYVVYSFTRDKDQMLQRQVDMNGGMANKYKYLIDRLTQEPTAKVVKVTRDHIHIRSEGMSTATNFLITENFNAVVIQWVSQSSVFGTHKNEWTWPHNYPQEKMIVEIEEYIVWKAEQVFGKSMIENYSTAEIKKTIDKFSNAIFKSVARNESYFKLDTDKKYYADNYIKSICVLIAGVLFEIKLINEGIDKSEDVFKKILGYVYQHNLNFANTYVKNSQIEFLEWSNLYESIKNDESFFILSFHIKLNEYLGDLKTFLSTKQPWIVEEEDYEDEEEGMVTYTREVQYSFIRDLHDIIFEDSELGLKIKPIYDNSIELDDESIITTINCIQEIANS